MIVRDKIAEILKVEASNQMLLAAAEGQDSRLWDLRVYVGRSNPWEIERGEGALNCPLININFDNVNFPKNIGGTVEKQQGIGVFNLDCLGFGTSRADGNGGHILGDLEAQDEAERAVTLTRRILMSAHYFDLDMNRPPDPAAGEPRKTLIGGRWPASITNYPPQIDEKTKQHVSGQRIALEVNFAETSPQWTPVRLEEIRITVKKTGEVVLYEQTFVSTPPAP